MMWVVLFRLYCFETGEGRGERRRTGGPGVEGGGKEQGGMLEGGKWEELGREQEGDRQGDKLI